MPDAAAPARPGPRGRGDLTQGAIGKTLLAFALPTLASSILQSLNGTINAIWVGRFLGEGALAATSNANMVMFLLTAFVSGFGMPSTILIGQAWGRKDVDDARRVFGTAAGGFAVVTVLIAIAGYFLAPAILHLLGTPGEAAPLALAYLRVIFLAIPALLLLTLMMMALRGAGDSLTPLWFMIIAVVLDSGLNPFFILGIGPFPRMGIAGAAVSAMASQNIGAGKWDRVGQVTRVGIVQSLLITGGLIVLLTLADRTVLSLFMGPDSPALPIARHIHLLASWNFLLFGVMMVLFATVRANGAVWAPLIILAVGLVPVRFGYILTTYGWLGADAIWTSFPVTSLINLTLAGAYYLNGSWKKARMSVAERPENDECTEEAEATREPGGALNPAG